jgi:putative copper export protein
VHPLLADTASLASAADGVRLTLHVLAAALWVGGQFTVAGLLPTVRTFGDDAPKAVARSLARLLWPAYAVLVITGFWNVSTFDVSSAPAAWKAVLVAKIVVVAAAGLAVLAHQRSSTPRGKAVFGAVGALTSVAALVLGVFLAG